MARRYNRYKRQGSIAGKIIIALLAFLGLLFVIDKIAGTDILQTLWNDFIALIKWLGKLAGGVK